MKIIKKALFTSQNKIIHKYLLSNNNGMSMEVIDLGCSILSLKVPDINGTFRDVVLGYKKPELYIENPVFFGTVIGRFSNRINKGEFNWQGETIKLEKNDGENHLHGGSKGFHSRIWDCIEESDTLTFRIFSSDQDSNYPGDIECFVSYLLTDDNELVINYKAETPSESIANLTNHSYFNLSGDGSASILNHFMKIDSDQFTEISTGAIPTGKLSPVEGTPFDFREYKEIGQDIDVDFEQLQMTDGYDHNYVLKSNNNVAVSVYSPESGIKMEMFTNSPGVQLYTGNGLMGDMLGKTGEKYKRRSGFCLETQFYPDAPNHPHFPQPIVKKNQPQEFETVFRFGKQNL